MARPEDLMGLGMPGPLAQLEGFTIPTAVAGATTAQATATLLTGSINLITTAASQTAVRLPSDTALAVPIMVYNSTSTAALVFPPTGGNINEAATNASFSVAQAKTTTFWRVSTTKWIAVLSA